MDLNGERDEGRVGGGANRLSSKRYDKTPCRMGKKKKKNALYLSVNVFSTKVLIGDTIFTSPNGDGTAILRGHPSHAKVQPPAGQRK